MSWNPQLEFQFANSAFPYCTTGSIMDFFEGFTYEHVNFIFAGPSHAQEDMHPSTHTSYYKYDFSDPGTSLYYNQPHGYENNEYAPRINEYRRPLENSPMMTYEEPTAAVSMQWGLNANIDSVECPRSHNNARDFQVVWQDNVDPDNMTYEELLELGEAVGTQSRGLSKELISLLPISKYKPGFFSRKKFRDERCVICQMEYKRKERRITLPCKHVYHSLCGSRWLSINKACPICYTEVFGDKVKR